MNMKIVEITKKLYKQEIDPNEAERLLLDLFAVSNNEVAVAFGDWLRTQRADIFYSYPTTKKLFEMYKKATDC